MKEQSFEITRRSVLYATKLCNAGCKFCYYRSEGNRKHAPLNRLINILKTFKEKYEIEFVDITGGEPTIHPQIKDIVKESCEIGIKPTVITNSQRPDVILDIINNGLEDLLISVHGFEGNHDEVVGIAGAFNKIVETFKFLNSKPFEFRVNTVLTKYSCKDAESLANIFIKYKTRMVNLISFNPYEDSLWRDKTSLDFQVDYSVQAGAAKKMIDILDKAQIWVNVRYIPFCFMKGYEKYVCNFLQLPYDPYEWDYTSSNSLSDSELKKLTKEALEAKRFGNTNREKFYQHMMHSIIKDNKKVHECDQCSLKEICDLIYTQYINAFGDSGYKSFEGKKIKDPMHFKKLAQIHYNLRSDKICK